MLIIGDEGEYHGRFPWVTVWLLVINVVMLIPTELIGEPFVMGLSMVPEEIITGQDLAGPKATKIWVYEKDKNGKDTGRDIEKDEVITHYPGPTPVYLTLLTSMFMHGGLAHILFNMWALIVFGRSVECAMGHLLFLTFYLLCGVLADFAHIASDPHSIIPSLGASGAIAGMMGAYLAMRPLGTIKVWIILVIDMPAVVAIGLWVLLQYLSTVLDPKGVEGVGYWAHLGGFAAGFSLMFILAQVLRVKNWILPRRPKEQVVRPVNLDSDKYSGYVTAQTLRRMQEKKNRDQGQ